MNAKTANLLWQDTLPSQAVPSAPSGFLHIRARQLVLNQLAGLEGGRLVFESGQDRWTVGTGEGSWHLQVLSPAFWPAVAFGGSVGAGEAFMAGHWRCDDPVGLMQLLVRNLQKLDALEGGLARIASPLRRLGHWLHRNSRAGSRHNIAAHYDLGNAFYRLWLDETLMYSCALFSHPGQDLAEASRAKLEGICRKLDLSPQDHVLEIGTGWGGFALHAAGRYGCRVTTVTLSREQYELARLRIDQAGLSARVEVKLVDYRELEGTYDKLVSVEMVEAVGAEFLPVYFQQCQRLLKPGGVMLLQAITIVDQRYRQALKSVDFIQKYVFPGGFLPSVTALSQAMTQASDLRPVHMEDMGPHYAETLRHWRQRFLDALPAVRALGYSPEFIRMWLFYLCYCEAGFRERHLGTVQMVLTRPGWRGALPVVGLFPPLYSNPT
ncbi:MAG: cyclopropane-fatty-acyl-phospholipid synthase family protein [Pseudomonadota bacterium]